MFHHQLSVIFNPLLTVTLDTAIYNCLWEKMNFGHFDMFERLTLTFIESSQTIHQQKTLFGRIIFSEEVND